MDNKQCCNCQNFRQHYGLDRKKIFRLHCGHCMLSGSRRKRPDTPACADFAPGLSDTEAFATKEYLSKEMLQYLFRLDLLPEIEEAPVPPHGRKRGNTLK